MVVRVLRQCRRAWAVRRAAFACAARYDFNQVSILSARAASSCEPAISTAFSAVSMASFGRFIKAYANAVFASASKFSGSSRSACWYWPSASSGWPKLTNAAPRFECASGLSGFSSSTRPVLVYGVSCATVSQECVSKHIVGQWIVWLIGNVVLPERYRTLICRQTPRTDHAKRQCHDEGCRRRPARRSIARFACQLLHQVPVLPQFAG